MADEKIIFSMNGVGKVLPHNNRVILKDIYLSFFYGAKIGIIGLNGSGKSTLLKIIAGVEKSYKGEVVWAPGYSVGYLEQEPQMDPDKTVLEVVQEGVQEVMDLRKEYDEISMKFMEPMDDDEMNQLIERQGELTDAIEHCDGWNIESKLERAMDALQCPPPEASVRTLSGGERRRVALCRLLLRQPDVLLLDEPTNHLDTESIQWLEAHLQQYKGTVIAVTHDRYFLDNVAGWILELDRGEGIPWKGNYSSWLDQKTKRLAMEEKQESKRRKTLERELEWVRMAPKARQAKQKARLGAYEKLAAADSKEKEANLEIYIPNGPHLGNKVIRFNDVSKAYPQRACLHADYGRRTHRRTRPWHQVQNAHRKDCDSKERGRTHMHALVDRQHGGNDDAERGRAAAVEMPDERDDGSHDADADDVVADELHKLAYDNVKHAGVGHDAEVQHREHEQRGGRSGA